MCGASVRRRNRSGAARAGWLARALPPMAHGMRVPKAARAPGSARLPGMPPAPRYGARRTGIDRIISCSAGLIVMCACCCGRCCGSNDAASTRRPTSTPRSSNGPRSSKLSSPPARSAVMTKPSASPGPQEALEGKFSCDLRGIACQSPVRERAGTPPRARPRAGGLGGATGSGAASRPAMRHSAAKRGRLARLADLPECWSFHGCWACPGGRCWPCLCRRPDLVNGTGGRGRGRAEPWNLLRYTGTLQPCAPDRACMCLRNATGG